MPFKSDAQRRYLFSRKPEVAEKFAKDSKAVVNKNVDLNLDPHNSIAAPKWAKNPWGEMLKRKGISSLTKSNKGF